MSVSGVLIIDKPAGMTSHDVVNEVRRKLGTRKVGHGGTLDPDVTGVLVLCVGDATRLLEYASAEEKTYEGVVEFGVGTDTDDATGKVLCTADASALSESDVVRVAQGMIGWQDQVVPRYSAVHIDGQRAYDLARAGVEVELPSRTIQIEHLNVWGFTPGETARASFQVTCSKGTYVRALCRDWGTQLGIPAHMHSLRRTASGYFRVEESVSLDAFLSSDNAKLFLLPSLQALRGMQQYPVDDRMATLLAHGQQILLQDADVAGPSCVAIVSEGKQLVAIAEVVADAHGRTQIRPKKVFWKREQ